MKKKFKLFFVFAILFLIPFVTHVSASQVVNVYLFEGDGCPHCAEAQKFFANLKNDPEYSSKFKLVEYEVWYNEDNKELMEDVADELGTVVRGVPFIVIGDDYFAGYSSARDQSIKEEILYAYKDYSYEDVVAEVKNGSSSNSSYNYNYRYNYDKDVDDIIDEFNNTFTDAEKEVVGVFTGFVLMMIIISIILSLAIAVYEAIIYWKVFKKAGRNGWEAIIPFYNIYVLFEISGYPGYYMFFVFIPCAGPIILFVFQIMAAISLAKKFKKGDGFHVLLWLLPIIGYSILAFGKDTYDGSLGEHKNQTNNNQNNSNTAPKEEPAKEEPTETKKETKTTKKTK